MSRTKSAAGDLVIAESPARAKTIERSSGPGRHAAAGAVPLRDSGSSRLADIAR
jgi:hypothetical protein